MSRRVVELIGVYHANGGLRGEAAYVLGRLFGSTHCSLCDITHSTVRRKPAWTSMVARLGVPVTLLHLDQMPPDVARAAGPSGTPVVLGRLDDDRLVAMLGPGDLDGLEGSVPGLEQALAQSAASQGLALG